MVKWPALIKRPVRQDPQIPDLTLSRTEVVTDYGVEVGFAFKYEGVIRFTDDVHGSVYESKDGTMTMMEPMCHCIHLPPLTDETPQSPQSNLFPEQRMWDRMCSSIDYPAARFRWKSRKAAIQHSNVWEFIIEATVPVQRDGNWLLKRFTLNINVSDPLDQNEDEIFSRIRWWLHNIARNEVDRLLIVNGENKYNNVPENQLFEYEEADEFNIAWATERAINDLREALEQVNSL